MMYGKSKVEITLNRFFVFLILFFRGSIRSYEAFFLGFMFRSIALFMVMPSIRMNVEKDSFPYYHYRYFCFTIAIVYTIIKYLLDLPTSIVYELSKVVERFNKNCL
ncbi:uncharacterized protein EV154DRAFT_516269, partial [Mucor mucedo]|uniref:uncharacterized protein n=1 Tax=Mucor mucedo TaxID=29922 RepID=UPI00221EA062